MHHGYGRLLDLRTDIKNVTLGTLEKDDRDLKQSLLGNMLLLWAFLGVIHLVASHLRALDIGWNARDLIQILLVGTLVLGAWFRDKMSVEMKSGLFMTVFFVAAVLGFLTLGFRAGGVFFFSLVILVAALIFTRKTLMALTVISSFFIVGITFIHSSTSLSFLSGTGATQGMPRVWGVYVISMIASLLTLAMALDYYRKKSRALLRSVAEKCDALEELNKNLVEAVSNILPICSYCKSIRNEEDDWKPLERYIQERSEIRFSHSICPECLKNDFPEVYEKMLKNGEF